MILAVLILSMIALIFSGCGGSGTTPNITQNGSISGRIMVPDNFKKGSENWIYPLAGASVDTTDSEGKKHMATTDNDGYYTIFDVASGHNYIITAEGTKKGSTIIIKDVAEQVKEGENYSAGTADAESTTLALVLENLAENTEAEIENINLSDIKNCNGFEESVYVISNSINDGNNVTADPLVDTAIESVVIPLSIITPNPVDSTKGALAGYLHSGYTHTALANGYVFAIATDGTILGYSKTLTIAEAGGYSEAGWWGITDLPINEEFTLVGFHPDLMFMAAICDYELTEPGYEKFKYNDGKFETIVTANYASPTGYGVGGWAGAYSLLSTLAQNWGATIYNNWVENLTNELLSQVEGYINEDEEETEILIVLGNFSNAIVNKNWAKAKSYCVVGSEEYEAVDELEDLYDELSALCDDINISYSGGGEAEVIISGKFAVVSGYSTCTVSCVPPGGEEISVIVSGEGSSYLEKVDNSWKIYKETGDPNPTIVEIF